MLGMEGVEQVHKCVLLVSHRKMSSDCFAIKVCTLIYANVMYLVEQYVLRLFALRIIRIPTKHSVNITHLTGSKVGWGIIGGVTPEVDLKFLFSKV